MRKAELLEIIANGENSGVEFKRDDIRPAQLAREVVAMTNFQGGRVILGVEDDGAIRGIQRSNLEEWVMNVIQEKVHPMILPFYEEVRVDEGKKVAVIGLPQGISKPYALRDSGREDIYVRVGSTSRLATREHMWRAEAMPVPRTGMGCLDEVRLHNYLADILRDPDLPATRQAWEARLLALGLMTEAADTRCCTVAGLVLFGKTPRRYLKQAGLRVFAFPGEDKEYRALLDTILDGPMVGRWEVDEAGRSLLDGGIIERFMDAIGPFISREASHIDENLRRRTRWHYPLEAVRETLVNALAHRDWTRFVEIEVGIYEDRFEVISPGALPNSMTVEKMMAGQRQPRNTLIMEVLRDYGYVDYRGMGIRTKIVPLTRAHTGKEPRFDASEDHLKTILYR